MKLNKSHKDKIIGGIIGVIFLFCTLFIKECFEKRVPKSDSKPADNSATFQSSDSSSQTIIQSQQNNSGAINVSNEYIGTKNVAQYQVPPKSSSNRGAKQPEINIEGNNGSNINTAPVGGNLTQIVTNHRSRNLDKEQIAKILSSIPKDCTVAIRFPYPDQEADGFSDQIMDLLDGSGRKAYKIRIRDIEAGTGESFSIKQLPDKPDMMVLTVYPQK